MRRPSFKSKALVGERYTPQCVSRVFLQWQLLRRQSCKESTLDCNAVWFNSQIQTLQCIAILRGSSISIPHGGGPSGSSAVPSRGESRSGQTLPDAEKTPYFTSVSITRRVGSDDAGVCTGEMREESDSFPPLLLALAERGAL